VIGTRRRVALALALVAAGAGTVQAATPGPLAESESRAASGNRWFGVSVLSGWFKADNALADYEWDTRPKPGWGIETAAGAGRYGLGLRLTQSATTQAMGSVASVSEATVTSRTLELVGRGNLVSFGAQQVFATASAGQLRISYDPDHVDIDTGGASPARVELAPVNTWTWGGGLGLERPLGKSLVGGVECSYRAFSLETAHRSGSTIVVGRDSFGEWNARLAIGWRRGL
jgi:hypothetical protein